ncbi:MAG: [Ni/Fe] hydrogenase small subunit [Polyangiaceae bacterium]|nr:[Ni/Fe] hydrogenase small subunit [Polyangiaceae bacterium]
MSQRDRFFAAELERRGVACRDFGAFVTGVTGLLALPPSASGTILRALIHKPKPTLVWLELDHRSGPTESFLRAGAPSVAQVMLDLLSVDYRDTLMVTAGARAEEHLACGSRQLDGGYLAVVEGAIPTGDASCAIGGRAAVDVACDVCRHALATIAVGTCAAFGGPAASSHAMGGLGVADAVPGLENFIHLPACPDDAEHLAALVAFYVTYGRFPALDPLHRPLFAQGKAIHDGAEWRAPGDASPQVEIWGDAGHPCFCELGCKGPATPQHGPTVGSSRGES